jgi:hypothetical protein
LLSSQRRQLLGIREELAGKGVGELITVGSFDRRR